MKPLAALRAQAYPLACLLAASAGLAFAAWYLAMTRPWDPPVPIVESVDDLEATANTLREIRQLEGDDDAPSPGPTGASHLPTGADPLPPLTSRPAGPGGP